MSKKVCSKKLYTTSIKYIVKDYRNWCLISESWIIDSINHKIISKSSMVLDVYRHIANSKFDECDVWDLSWNFYKKFLSDNDIYIVFWKVY